ncbi:hypothetical protein [Clostridium algidicarnis]|nr:hypothetical protein [Clostridium algidicarnis]
MIDIIHILGSAGSGTSTLGKKLENKLNYIHLEQIINLIENIIK